MHPCTSISLLECLAQGMATCIKTASALFASLLLHRRASEIFNKSLGLFRHVEPQVFADDSLAYNLLESNHNALESHIYK